MTCWVHNDPYRASGQANARASESVRECACVRAYVCNQQQIRYLVAFCTKTFIANWQSGASCQKCLQYLFPPLKFWGWPLFRVRVGTSSEEVQLGPYFKRANHWLGVWITERGSAAFSLASPCQGRSSMLKLVKLSLGECEIRPLHTVEGY